MKHIKKFENFSKDGIEVDNQTTPEINPATSLKAKQYVDVIFSQGSGSDVNDLCKELGCDAPKTDEELDRIKEMAVDYFTKNPERIKDFSGGVRRYPYKSTDGVVRTNNIGGVFHESKKPGPDEEGSVKVTITKDELKLFSKETPLINLIRKNKISLFKDEVWYDKNDHQTRKILDIFLEIDDEKINEGVGTVLLTIFAAYKLLKWILNILVKRERGKFIKKLKSSLNFLSVSMVNSKDGFKNALSVAEFGDRYYIRGVSTFIARIPDIRIMKNENLMIFDESRIELTEEEHKEIVNIIVKSL